MTESESTQKTPQGETIPVPTRADFLRDLRKVAKPDESSDKDAGGTEQDQSE